MKIEDILKRIENRGLFQSVKRVCCEYDHAYAMQIVEAIGKQRNPKFVIDDENRFTYENLVRWIMGDSRMMCLDPVTRQPKPGRLTAGIYIAGNTGTGKSWTLEVMTAFATIDNIQIYFDNGQSRCLHWQNYRVDTICEDYTREGGLDKYKRYQIMGIQDLGAEPVESLHMGNRIDVLRQLLEYRGDRTDRITLITSNLPICHKQLTERYGDRVASRLMEMCNYFEIRGKDRRRT